MPPVIEREKSRARAAVLAVMASGLLAAPGCHREAVTFISPSTLPPAIAPISGARGVRAYTQKDTSTWVTYEIEETYPGAKTLGQISERLQRAGWSPLKNDWLNPRAVTSHVRGWFFFVDPRSKPPAAVHRWSAPWRNAAGDIVFYELHYQSPYRGPASAKSPPDNARLLVTAALIPGPLASALAAPPPAGPPVGKP